MKAGEILSHLPQGCWVSTDKRDRITSLLSSDAPLLFPRSCGGGGHRPFCREKQVLQGEAGDVQTSSYPILTTDLLSHGKNIEIRFKQLCLFYSIKSLTCLCFFPSLLRYSWQIKILCMETPIYTSMTSSRRFWIPAEDIGSVFSGLSPAEHAITARVLRGTG